MIRSWGLISRLFVIRLLLRTLQGRGGGYFWVIEENPGAGKCGGGTRDQGRKEENSDLLYRAWVEVLRSHGVFYQYLKDGSSGCVGLLILGGAECLQVLAIVRILNQKNSKIKAFDALETLFILKIMIAMFGIEF